MSQPKGSSRLAVRGIATGVAASLTFCLATPHRAAADPAPLDPYGPPPPVVAPTYGPPAPPTPRPVDPYAGPAGAPPLVDASPQPLYPPPAPPPYPPPPPQYAPAPPQYQQYAPPAYPQYAPAYPPAYPPAPQYAPYSAPVPDLTYRPAPPVTYEMRPRTGLIAGGLSILGGLWVISTVSGVLAEHNELAIPIAGPILTAVDLNKNHGRSAGLSLATGALITDALFQATGLIMAIAGGASRVRVAKRAPLAPSVYPSVSPYGAGVSGRF